MERLSQSEIEFITQCLKDGKPLPDSYRHIIPFEIKKEYELTYADKEREEDILADTFAVPLQPVKTFGSNGDGWTNKLISGDNLQVLKTLMNDSEVKGRVKLIYIDPPFGTGDIYDARGEAPAYSAKLQGAKFIEFLRKRLVFLREILADDGSIYVRTDYHFGHYLKAIMDEILGKENFRNETIVRRGQAKAGFFKQFDKIKSVAVAYDTLLWYSKSPNTRFNKITTQAKEEHRISGRWSNLIKAKAYARPTMRYEILGVRPEPAQWMWSKERAFRAVNNYQKYLEIYKKSKESLEEYWERTGKRSEFVGKDNNQIQYWIPPRERELLDNDWLDIKGYSHITDYPTENSEELLERVLQVTDRNDIVLDAFAGSGTTGAVAEKLGRRWIMIDCGKLAVYTMQKRLLNLREEIGNRGKPLKAKPFTLYNAGLYEYQKLKQLPWEEYRDFVLKLFQCRDEPHRIAGVELDGCLGADDVLVFNYQKYKDAVLDRGFIDDIHSILGDKIGRRFFIIAPAASVIFLEDYIEKGSTRYFVLRIPYSIIDELHRKGFTHIKQPVSEMDVNNTVDAVGFDFVQIPDIECEYYLSKPKGQVGLGHSGKDAVIKIRKFESNIISKKPLHYENMETLSMVMVDYDYDGKVFNFDDVFYAEDLKRQSYEIRFDSTKLDGQMMIIYIDIFGNEKREVKRLGDFGVENIGKL